MPHVTLIYLYAVGQVAVWLNHPFGLFNAYLFVMPYKM